MTIRWQLQRLAWQHGCADPRVCGLKKHNRNCPAECTAHARACPQRNGGGLVLTELKTAKSGRTIALPAALVQALKAHRTAQFAERMAAGSRWHDGDFVWCQANGRPIGAHADWDGWIALLKAPKVRRRGVVRSFMHGGADGNSPRLRYLTWNRSAGHSAAHSSYTARGRPGTAGAPLRRRSGRHWAGRRVSCASTSGRCGRMVRRRQIC